jgi:DNA (cytosine-5)-methyltransferase 1
MRYGSVCSGIEAASVAWHPLGWTPAWFAEIEAFPSAVLKHHYPAVPNLGDMTKYEEWPDAAIDVLVGGTPCQSFSVAGLRKGLDDPRGNLMLTFGALARRYRPQWLVWENVPGVLSSNGGRDFGTFLGMLGQLGYGFAYRVLDAQYFGVAQRRRRVFVVGCLGDWRRAAAVLFERHSLSGHPAPSRQARQVSATLTSPRTGGGGSYRLDAHDVDGGFIQAVDVCPTLRAGGNRTGVDRPPGTDVDTADSLIPCWWDGGDVATTITTKSDNQRMPDKANAQLVMQPVTHALTGEGFDASEDGTGRGTPLVPVGVTIHGTDPTVQKVASYDDVAQCLRARTPGNIDNSSTTVVQQPVPFDTTQITSAANYSRPQPGDPCHPLAAGAHPPAIAFAQNQRDEVRVMPVAGALAAEPGAKQQTYVMAFTAKDHGADAGEIAPTLRAMGHGASHANGGGQVAVAFSSNMSVPDCQTDGTTPTLKLGGHGGGNPPAVAVAFDTYNQSINEHTSQTIKSPQGAVQESVGAVLHAMQVRRLTPEECEALQGFRRGYTAIPWRGKPAAACPDGPRYKSLRNSMAVPVMAWIGQRIAAVEAIREEAAA